MLSKEEKRVIIDSLTYVLTNYNKLTEEENHIIQSIINKLEDAE